MSIPPLSTIEVDGSWGWARLWVVAEDDSKMEVVVMRSKCLPQGDEDLRCLDSSKWIQVVSDVNSHRAHGRCIA